MNIYVIVSQLFSDCSDLVFTEAFLSLVLKFKRTSTSCIASFHIKMLEIITT